MSLVAHEHEHAAAAMTKASDDRRRYTQFNHDIHCARPACTEACDDVRESRDTQRDMYKINK